MENTKDKEKIPYIVINRRNTDVHMECESVYKENLQETFMKVLQTCMEYHEFQVVDELKLFEVEDEYTTVASLDEGTTVASLDDLVCDECGCRVVQKKYITIINEVKYCGACNPIIATIDKGVYDRFQKFLDKKGGSSEIWYFIDNDWINFIIE
jgi:hypothetical protein